ncbi:MAG: RNA-binding cell elongation regulator Jag/EloR [Spirochaetota bacterium]|nr:RNA-binding cell elongation regulator Jag/EloR [Spirochaetota bacterium]
MKVLEIEGKKVEDATRKGLSQLGIDDASKVKIEVVDEGKSGIFGFGVSRPVRIRLYYNENTTDVGEKAKEILLNIIKMMGLEGKVKDIKEGSSRVYIELESENSGLIIGKYGKNLEALQFILSLMVNNITGTDKKIILDIASYRDKREKSLRKLSRDIAVRVVKTGKPYTLEPMNPFERRLIHLTLQNDSRVRTRSEGDGIYRKVKVYPNNIR